MKKLIIAISILLVIVAVPTFLYFSNLTLLTGSERAVISVTVIDDPNYSGKNGAVVFKDQETISRIYQSIKSTSIKANYFPDHIGSMQMDSFYKIEIEYKNSKTDTIALASEGSILYRFINTKGTSGDPGFVYGHNTEIRGLLDNLVNSAHNIATTGGSEMNLLEELTQKGYGKQAEILKQMEQNCIKITTSKSSEDNIVIGESKIGGNPHLPSDFVWHKFNGKPLAFIAQINLEHIAGYDVQKLLPDKGMLYFFHEGGEDVWGFDPKDKGGFKVVYYDGEVADLRITPLPDELEDYLKFSPCKLRFEQMKSYPSDLYELNQQLFGGDRSNANDAFFDAIEKYNGTTVNKLFGYPDLIQGDIFLESQLVTNGLYCGDETGYNDPRRKELEKGVSDWMLLFQIDSDNNADMMWGDVGRIYFTIKKEDLKNRNFDAAWASFQCG